MAQTPPEVETRNDETLSWLNVQLVMITEGTGYYPA
jgi:hypothetical protein